MNKHLEAKLAKILSIPRFNSQNLDMFISNRYDVLMDMEKVALINRSKDYYFASESIFLALAVRKTLKESGVFDEYVLASEIEDVVGLGEE